MAEMNWISVKDRMPEDNEKVLTYTRSGRMVVARWCKRQEKFMTAGRIDATHWMPLPSAPEVEGWV